MRRIPAAAGKVILVLAGIFALGLASLYSAGTLNVYVHEKQPGGHRLWLPIPALALAEGIRFAPERDLRQATVKWQPYLPAVRAACLALARCPDTRLVEVEDATDHVLVRKQGERLEIDVDSKDSTVRVSFPLRIAAAIAEELRRQQSGTI